MGDIIETTIFEFQPLLYYRVSGNGFWFDIKTHRKALVGLSNNVCSPCKYWQCKRVPHGLLLAVLVKEKKSWREKLQKFLLNSYFMMGSRKIGFSNPGKISISKRLSAAQNKTGLPFTLTENNYNRFWISWDSKSLQVGIGHNPEPLHCVYADTIPSDLNYITFTTNDRQHPCSYKFKVPPLISKIPKSMNGPKITAGKLEWKQCDNQLPDEAVIGGYLYGEVVYIIRANHMQSLTPGMFVPSKGLAYFPWGGSANPTSNFEALCGFNLIWKAAFSNKIPIDSFVAGYSENNNEPLYIGRALHKEHKLPGKVQLSHAVCYIPYEGREISVKKFEVLTVPGLNASSANEYVGPTLRSLHNMNEEYELVVEQL